MRLNNLTSEQLRAIQHLKEYTFIYPCDDDSGKFSASTLRSLVNRGICEFDNAEGHDLVNYEFTDAAYIHYVIPSLTGDIPVKPDAADYGHVDEMIDNLPDADELPIEPLTDGILGDMLEQMWSDHDARILGMGSRYSVGDVVLSTGGLMFGIVRDVCVNAAESIIEWFDDDGQSFFDDTPDSMTILFADWLRSDVMSSFLFRGTRLMSVRGLPVFWFEEPLQKVVL